MRRNLMPDRWWKIQEPGDPGPVAVATLGADNLIRRYVPGEGLVDWPPMNMWVFGDEHGGTEISQAEAVKLMKAGVGKIPDGVDTASSRGAAGTVAAPV
jgi:hypothetical protein